MHGSQVNFDAMELKRNKMVQENARGVALGTSHFTPVDIEKS